MLCGFNCCSPSPWENGHKLQSLSIPYYVRIDRTKQYGVREKSTINYSMSHVSWHAYESFYCNNSTDWIDCLIAHLLITHNARPLVQINIWIIYVYIYIIVLGASSSDSGNAVTTTKTTVTNICFNFANGNLKPKTKTKTKKSESCFNFVLLSFAPVPKWKCDSKVHITIINFIPQPRFISSANFVCVCVCVYPSPY